MVKIYICFNDKDHEESESELFNLKFAENTIATIDQDIVVKVLDVYREVAYFENKFLQKKNELV